MPRDPKATTKPGRPGSGSRSVVHVFGANLVDGLHLESESCRSGCWRRHVTAMELGSAFELLLRAAVADAEAAENLWSAMVRVIGHAPEQMPDRVLRGAARRALGAAAKDLEPRQMAQDPRVRRDLAHQWKEAALWFRSQRDGSSRTPLPDLDRRARRIAGEILAGARRRPWTLGGVRRVFETALPTLTRTALRGTAQAEIVHAVDQVAITCTQEALGASPALGHLHAAGLQHERRIWARRLTAVEDRRLTPPQALAYAAMAITALALLGAWDPLASSPTPDAEAGDVVQRLLTAAAPTRPGLAERARTILRHPSLTPTTVERLRALLACVQLWDIPSPASTPAQPVPSEPGGPQITFSTWDEPHSERRHLVYKTPTDRIEHPLSYGAGRRSKRIICSSSAGRTLIAAVCGGGGPRLDPDAGPRASRALRLASGNTYGLKWDGSHYVVARLSGPQDGPALLGSEELNEHYRATRRRRSPR